MPEAKTKNSPKKDPAKGLPIDDLEKQSFVKKFGNSAADGAARAVGVAAVFGVIASARTLIKKIGGSNNNEHVED